MKRLAVLVGILLMVIALAAGPVLAGPGSSGGDPTVNVAGSVKP